MYILMVAEPGNWDKHMYRRGKPLGSQGRTFNPRTKRSRNVSPIDSPNGGFTNIYSDIEIRN